MEQKVTGYRNPVLRGVHPDPSVVRVGEDYYLANSSFQMVPGVPIYHSRDLIHWRLLSHALTRPSQFLCDRTSGKINIFAPTLRYFDGVFYMITTNVADGGGNFYVIATDPAGPWSEPFFVDEGFFDPSLFFDDDGTVFYTKRGGSGVTDTVQAEIDITTGKLLTPLRSISRGFMSDDCEGPHLYKIDGRYYLLHAEGGTRYLHMGCIGRSDSPWGPFEASPYNPLVSQHIDWSYPVKSTGHGDLVQAHDGSWWIVFLGTRHPGYNSLATIGRETFLLPVTWMDGWPTTQTRQLADLDVEVPTLPQHAWPASPERDNFDNQTLGHDEYVFIHAEGEAALDLKSEPGVLRMRPLSSATSQSHACGFLGVRQKAFNFSYETSIQFEPCDGGDEAGICIFQTSRFHYDLLISQREGQKVVLLRQIVGDIQNEQVVAPATEQPLRMKVTGHGGVYRFHVARGAGGFAEVGSGLANLISTEMAGSWCGALIGLFVNSSDGEADPLARFDYIEADFPLV